MKDKKVGVLILVSALLCFSIFIVLCNVSMYICQLSGAYSNEFISYVPKTGLVAIIIVIVIGLYYTYKNHYD